MRLVAYSKASRPKFVRIQTRPPANPNAVHCVLRFSFGDVPAAPPPPQPPLQCRSGTIAVSSSEQGRGSGAVAASSGATPSSSSSSCSMVDLSKGSFTEHAYVATGLNAPWRMVSCNQQWCVRQEHASGSVFPLPSF